MFTGLIEEIGQVKYILWGSKSARLTIGATKILDDIKTGDSINTNGACLTVTSFKSNQFSVDVMDETMRRTNLQTLRVGSKVNLERALKLNDRLDGHLVSGHIDGTGTITNLKKDDNAVWVTIKTSPDVSKYIIQKGSIAIDGISLTIAEINNETFQVSIIPHTGLQTTLLSKQINETVNIECDQVGKYIEKFLFNRDNKSQHSSIDMEFLKENGFL